MPIDPPPAVPPGPNAMPTATQAENDLAALGQTVFNKQPDGSPPDPYVGWNPREVTLLSISPLTGPIPNLALVVNCRNATNDSKIVFDGVEQTTVRNGDQLTATIAGGTVGKKTVLVRNPQGDSNVASFTFTLT